MDNERQRRICEETSSLLLENQIDGDINVLGDKVSLLRQASFDIGSQLDEEDPLMSNMNTGFENNEGGFLGALGKLNTITSQSDSKQTCKLIMVVLFILFVFYIIIKTKK